MNKITSHDLDLLIATIQNLREETYHTELATGRSYTAGREEELEKHSAQLPSYQAVDVAERLELTLLSLWNAIHGQNLDAQKVWKQKAKDA